MEESVPGVRHFIASGEFGECGVRLATSVVHCWRANKRQGGLRTAHFSHCNPRRGGARSQSPRLRHNPPVQEPGATLLRLLDYPIAPVLRPC
jgi:hypothetical protein